MRNIFFIICFISLISCNYNNNYEERFSKIENENFSDFRGYSITYRYGSYLISNTNVEKDDKRIFIIKKGITGKIKNIRDNNNTFANKSEANIKFLEKMLNRFDKLDVANLSVDNSGNVQFVFFLYKCSYRFLKLSDSSSLKNTNITHFKKYKDNWYLYKECSE